MVRTKTDPVAVARAVDDEPTRFRDWGTERTYPFPPPSGGEWLIGSGPDCWLRLGDARKSVSRRHALLVRDGARWLIRDEKSKNGLWIDGERTSSAAIVPGAEIGLGRRRMVVESPRTIRQRALLARFIGWRPETALAVDRALRALRAYATMTLPLSLTGEDDLVGIARRIHREVVGEAHPFVVTQSDAGADANAAALRTAEGGTLCLVGHRLLDDLRVVRALSSDRAPQSRVVICTRVGEQLTSIEVPALATRRSELARIVDEYAADAIADLGARPESYTRADRARLLAGEPETLGEIEREIRRLVEGRATLRDTIVDDLKPAVRWMRSYWPEADTTYFFEMDEDGWVLRQVELRGPDKTPVAASALAEHPTFERDGLEAVQAYEAKYGGLAEKPIEPPYDEELIEIERAELERVWQLARAHLERSG